MRGGQRRGRRPAATCGRRLPEAKRVPAPRRFQALVGRRCSEVFGSQTRVPGDSGEHPRTQFVAVVKREDVVGPTWTSKHPMRPSLTSDTPADAQQRGQDSCGSRRRPSSHGLA
jgi:hypothetical protein